MSMPNILLDKHIFPELLQDYATVNNCLKKLHETYQDNYHNMELECEKLWKILHKKNVSLNVAQTILSLV